MIENWPDVLRLWEIENHKNIPEDPNDYWGGCWFSFTNTEELNAEVHD